MRYEIRLNAKHYGKVVNDLLYLSKNLPKLDVASFEVPEQSAIIKAAWLVLDEDQKRGGRFYTVTARIADWNSPNPPENLFREAVLGLVGLHIVHKTHDRPASVWASFEQIDNIEGGRAGEPPTSFCSEVATGARVR